MKLSRETFVCGKLLFWTPSAFKSFDFICFMAEPTVSDFMERCATETIDVTSANRRRGDLSIIARGKCQHRQYEARENVNGQR